MNSLDENRLALTEPYQIGICPDCGRPLMARKLIFCNVEMRIACECVLQKNREERERDKKIEHLRRVKKLKQNSGIPPLQSECSFENFEPRDGTERALAMAKKYVEKFSEMKKGLIFTGNTGCGKTHLASAIGNELLEQGINVKYIRAAELPVMLRSRFSKHLTEKDILEPLELCRLLIVDDLGADDGNERNGAVWQSLIDYRLCYNRPIIFTTNLTQEEITKSFDKRAVDRLLSINYVCNIMAKSYRQKNYCEAKTA